MEPNSNSNQEHDDLEPVGMDMEESSGDDEVVDQNGNHDDELENGDDDCTHDDNVDGEGTHHDNTNNDPRPPSDTSSPRRKQEDSSKHLDAEHKSDARKTTNIVQVLNIAPTASLEQLKTLFGYLGDIVNIELYNSDQPNTETHFKVCFVEFASPSSVLMAQHLTNTVFIDRTLVVLPYNKDKIPDRETAIANCTGSDLLTNFDCGFTSQITNGVGGTQVIATLDPRLTALGLQQYPHLPINTDPSRVEEIRRTVYIGNLDSTIPPDQVMKFFNDIGEVKYIRMAGDDTQATRFAFVEFTHQSSIANALQHDRSMLGSRSLKINHSNNAIVKPQPKLAEMEGGTISKKSSSHHHDHKESRDSRHHHSSSGSSRYDRDRRDHDDRSDRYHGRVSPFDRSRSRRSRSRDIGSSRSRRSRSRSREPQISRRSRSPLSREKSSSRRRRRRNRSRDVGGGGGGGSSSRRRSRSNENRSSKSSRHRHKSSSHR